MRGTADIISDDAAGLPKHHKATANEKLVILGSSLGTVFEWYDFYLYGLLATIITAQFFSGVNETTGFIFALAAFAAGFAVRPFGALVFGRIGDMVGRKNTFLVTMGIMGLSTFLVGLLPSYASIGVSAPLMLVALRLLQGLALGGEYGGAATYVAEHAPDGKRGFYTSFIQTTATLGLFAALLVVIGVRYAVGEEAFRDWGWRIPFLVSALLLGVSLWIRMQLEESPAFTKMKAEGRVSKAPLTEAFARWGNLRIVLIALVGAVMGQAVVWYTGQFYALFFLEKMLKVDGATTNVLIAIALLLATPAFVFWGWLSDRVGRKPIIMAGCLLAAITYFPLFDALSRYANPALYAAAQTSPVVVTADDARCSVQFDPIGANKFDLKTCDIAKSFLAKAGVAYANTATPGAEASVRIGATVIPVPVTASLAPDARRAAIAGFQAEAKAALAAAGYPEAADPAAINKPVVIGILFILVLYVTMVYGPIAALLVELFPTNIRYTSMSLPYHIGNGWFGGFLPTVAFAMVAATGDIYYGLWYPVVVAAICFVAGMVLLPETFRRSID
ncbi:MFS transporter [Polymorphobacter multimanifer]|uniref:MFS family permease n=1 Tax=Polymorphobacter multimanifer TaxID=1070431 RepID=A0A841LGZ1_9SPHN|nr:MFS transporter [Polymorphobacter multimanifer]MBB6229065.1 MFS family permease [Polymorphobacter multimanifer]GGI84418.1 MFS transporter [Polymorphobacter multimanifer]